MREIVCGKEKVYFVISLIVSLVIYVLLVVSIVGIAYALMFALVAAAMHGVLIGNIKGNCIKVTDNQFKEIHNIAQELAQKMEIYPLPEIYVMQSGGLLNAFATRFLGRNFVVLYSDMLELAYERGGDALSFVICHELAHIKRKHVSRRWLLYPSMIVPFLGTAYSRACEYTCDLFGKYFVPQGAVLGLLVLAGGKKLYNSINVSEVIKQAEEERGFWVWLSEVLSTHPNMTKRIRQVSIANNIYKDKSLTGAF
jgi:Zn-dependent protease with chaperone function